MKLYQVVSEGQKLNEILDRALDQFRQYSRLTKKEALDRMTVYIQERKTLRSHIFVKEGKVVSFMLPQEFMAKPYFRLKREHIVFEDDSLIVVDKPAGLPTQATRRPGEDHMYGAVIAYLTEKSGSNLAYVGLHHRLDRDTSGLILMTKKASVNKSISEQFKSRTIEKKYLALVEGEKPKGRWDVDLPIGRIFGTKEFRFGVDRKKGDPALTKFEYISTPREGWHKIECQPITGRTHQIRIHLASCKLPIVGDRLYGSKSDQPLQLQAYELKLSHPRTQEPLVLRSSRSLLTEKST